MIDNHRYDDKDEFTSKGLLTIDQKLSLSETLAREVALALSRETEAKRHLDAAPAFSVLRPTMDRIYRDARDERKAVRTRFIRLMTNLSEHGYIDYVFTLMDRTHNHGASDAGKCDPARADGAGRGSFGRPDRVDEGGTEGVARREDRGP